MELELRDFSSAASSQLGASRSRVEAWGQSSFPSLWNSPSDPLRGSTDQTHGGMASLPPSLEQKLSFGQGACSQDRKDWGKKGVFVFRKLIPFTLKIKHHFFSDQKRTFWNVGEEMVLFPFALLEHPPKSTFLLCWGSVRRVCYWLTIPVNSCMAKVLRCRVAWILMRGKVIFLLLRFCFTYFPASSLQLLNINF